MKRAFTRASLALLFIIGLAAALPASADTEGELGAAETQLNAAEADLQRVAAAWSQAQADLAETQDQIDLTQERVDDTRSQLLAIQGRLEDRAIEAFMTGGSAADLDVLLASDDFGDFSDRLEFVGNVVDKDLDLATAAEVQRVELERAEAELEALEEELSDEQAELARQRDSLASEVDRLEALKQQLEDKLAAEREAAREAAAEAAAAEAASTDTSGGGGGGGEPVGSGAIQVCPVQGGASFTDSYGDPRSGGRAHAGQDLLAPAGTPVVAVHSGSASQSTNSLGGLTVGLNHDGGGWTYYAHLSGYAAGGHVSAGTVIGYVGSTGNAGSINHLHFEYHPGGAGAAPVNPYSMLTAVC
ncbi:MAG: peptidoglycan DD-metalloendopeptidase family protein [Actinomycetota bacterium]